MFPFAHASQVSVMTILGKKIFNVKTSTHFNEITSYVICSGGKILQFENVLIFLETMFLITVKSNVNFFQSGWKAVAKVLLRATEER